MFLSIYVLRTIVLCVEIIWQGTYQKLYETNSGTMITIQFLLCLLYDTAPVIVIMLKHRRTLECEDRATSQAIMTTSPVLDTSDVLSEPGDTNFGSSRLATMVKVDKMRLSMVNSSQRVTHVDIKLRETRLKEYEGRKTLDKDHHMLWLAAEDEQTKNSSTLNGSDDAGQMPSDDVLLSQAQSPTRQLTGATQENSRPTQAYVHYMATTTRQQSHSPTSNDFVGSNTTDDVNSQIPTTDVNLGTSGNQSDIMPLYQYQPQLSNGGDGYEMASNMSIFQKLNL